MFDEVVNATRRQMRFNYGVSANGIREELENVSARMGVNLLEGMGHYAQAQPQALVPAGPPQPAPRHLVLVPEMAGVGRVEQIAWRPPMPEEDVTYMPNVVPVPSEGRLYPAFASRAALHIEAKVGRMPSTEANALVADRVYTAMCRDARVRTSVMSANRGLVMRAYFELNDAENWAAQMHRLPSCARFNRGVRRGVDVQ